MLDLSEERGTKMKYYGIYKEMKKTKRKGRAGGVQSGIEQNLHALISMVSFYLPTPFEPGRPA